MATSILNSTSSLDGATIYVTLFPCNECAKLIIQAGIKEVVYLYDKHADAPSTLAAKMMFMATNTKCRRLSEADVIIND